MNKKQIQTEQGDCGRCGKEADRALWKGDGMCRDCLIEMVTALTKKLPKNGRRQKPFYAIRQQEMVRLSLEGQTLQAIADKYGLSRERIRQLLKEEGIVSKQYNRSTAFRPKAGGLTRKEKFFKKVSLAQGDCHRWEGAVHPKGYGVTYMPKDLLPGIGNPVKAAKAAYYWTHGRWPEFLIRVCESVWCVNPMHHFEGDMGDVATLREERRMK